MNVILRHKLMSDGLCFKWAREDLVYTDMLLAKQFNILIPLARDNAPSFHCLLRLYCFILLEYESVAKSLDLLMMNASFLYLLSVIPFSIPDGHGYRR